MDNKRNNDEFKELVIEAYAELHSGPAVAERLNTSTNTVYFVLKEAGVERVGLTSPIVQDRKKALQGDEAEAAAQDYANGMSLTDLCDKYDVGTYAIYTAVEDAGVPRRPHGAQPTQVTDEEAEEMVRLYIEENLSQDYIGYKIGYGQPTVSRILRKEGVDTRRHCDMRGENHPSWKGGRVRMGNGYIGVKVDDSDPMASMRTTHGYILEHRLVMARSLGRPLKSHETVHHINGKKDDNRLSNLQLRIGKHGKGKVMRCADCGSHNIVTEEID